MNPASFPRAQSPLCQAQTGSHFEQERVIAFTIFGEPASKANSRKIVTIGGRPSSIKSDKGRSYERDALRQIPIHARQRVEYRVAITLRIFYASERPDLDESLILDVLQDRYTKDKRSGERVLTQPGVYRNDRQVREKHVFHAIDKRNPRTVIEIRPMASVPFAPGLFA